MRCRIYELDSGQTTYKSGTVGTSLAVQWLRLQASDAGGGGSIPGGGTNIPHTARQKNNN